MTRQNLVDIPLNQHNHQNSWSVQAPVAVLLTMSFLILAQYYQGYKLLHQEGCLYLDRFN